jgi:virulence-associated protein VagC
LAVIVILAGKMCARSGFARLGEALRIPRGLPRAPNRPPVGALTLKDAAMGVHQTKTFRSGRGVALRLPGGFDAGEAMVIEQQGDRLTIRRARHRAEATRKLRSVLPALEAIGQSGPPR